MSKAMKIIHFIFCFYGCAGRQGRESSELIGQVVKVPVLVDVDCSCTTYATRGVRVSVDDCCGRLTPKQAVFICD